METPLHSTAHARHGVRTPARPGVAGVPRMTVPCRTGRTRAAAPFFTLTALALLPGCASLDPKPDIDRAAALVEARAGQAPDWSADWTESLLAPWDGTSPLTADHAVAIALRNNRALRAMLEEIAVSRADLVQSGLLPNPVIAVTLGFPLHGADGVKVGASVVEQFAAIWLIPSRERAARAKLDQRVLAASDAALDLVARVRSLHARILLGERGLALRREHLALLEQSESAIRARVGAGEASQLDLSRQRLERLKRISELAESEAEVDGFRRELLETLGLAQAPVAFALAGDDDAALPPLPAEDEASALARVQRLTVVAARAAADAAAAQLDEAARGRVTDLAAGLDYERDDDGKQTLGPSFELAVPIFDTGEARIAGAEAEARRLVIEADGAAQRAVREARQAWRRAAAAAQLAVMQRDEILPETDRVMSLLRHAYASGQADLNTRLLSQQEHIESRIRMNELALEERLARIELDRALGGRSVP